MKNSNWITKLIEEAGLPEPYRWLTDTPDQVSRWRSRH